MPVESLGIAAAPEKRSAGDRTIGRIPVRNLWLLMLYASEFIRIGGEAWIGLDEDPEDLPNLVAELLCRIVEKRLRRNLSSGYQNRQDVLTRVRGRIDVLQTERRRLLERGRVACRFEHLTLDTPRNRLVRSALETLARIVAGHDLQYRCRRLGADFVALGVGPRKPTAVEMSADRFGRRDADDRATVALSELAHDLALPAEDAGSNLLFAPNREEVWVRRLYEKAVAGFYQVTLRDRGWDVQAGRQLSWPVDAGTTGMSEILPGMRTDIVLTLRARERRIVIDTKFSAIVTPGWYRAELLKSGYLYQIYAYLRSQEGDTIADRAEGLLLHPAIGGQLVDEAVRMQGHVIRFSTVDLSATAAEIRQRWLHVVEKPVLQFN